MAVGYCPRIVTEGMVLCLDAANRESYPGSGTVWSSLVGGLTGALTNGPTFNSANGGSIVFDGVDDFISVPNLVINTNIGFTIDLWIYLNDPQPVYGNFWSYWYNASDFEFGTYATGSSQGKFIVKDNGAGGAPAVFSLYVGNQWSNIVFTINQTTPFIYTNGKFTQTAGNFRNSNITITELLKQTGGNVFYKASHSSIKIYNRALTPAEILQNYNALKGRFAI